MFRRRNGTLEFFLAHPGGPFSRKTDEGFWTIPKGEQGAGESLFQVAQREFVEETGLKPCPPFIELGYIEQKGGKLVYAWGFEGDHEGPITSNTFRLEWPPDSGRFRDFPEIDRAEFFTLEQARIKLKETQIPLLERLVEKVEPKPAKQ